MNNFAILDITYGPYPNGIIITLPTNSPCHLTCYWTDKTPLKHHTSRVVRGLTVPWGVYFCFVGWNTVEQEEEGDTLYHTFLFPEWPICVTLESGYDLSVGTSPPYWEPWGATLTENQPWTQAFPADPITYSLAGGILTLSNPIGAKSGLRCIIPWESPILLVKDSLPLCFAAKSTEAKITNPDDWTAIHVNLSFELDNVWIEFIINRGTAWGPFPKADRIYGNIYFTDYGLGPTPINLLNIFKAVRQSQGYSIDPTGWKVDLVYDLLEHTIDPTAMNHKVDWINLFHAPVLLTLSQKQMRYFTFRGEVDSVLSPSVGPIFKYCRPEPAPALFEYYNTGDDGGHIIWSVLWHAQTFTPSLNHTITSVKLKLYRVGLPGTLTVGIRATTLGKPSGPDLCVGSINVDDLTLDTNGEWREIEFTTNPVLTAGIQYAIVARVSSIVVLNFAVWRADSSGTYAGGRYFASGDSGVTWGNPGALIDFMFEEWGLII